MFIVPVVRVHFKQFVWIYLSELKKRETGALGASGACLAPTEAERRRTVGSITVECENSQDKILGVGERETGIEPATFALARRRSTTEPLAHKSYNCLRPGSNRRHMDFQSIALPTELPRRAHHELFHPSDSMIILLRAAGFVNRFL